MTYRDLLEKLQALTPEQLEKEACYQNDGDGDFYEVRDLVPGTDYGQPDDQFILEIEQ